MRQTYELSTKHLLTAECASSLPSLNLFLCGMLLLCEFFINYFILAYINTIIIIIVSIQPLNTLILYYIIIPCRC